MKLSDLLKEKQAIALPDNNLSRELCAKRRGLKTKSFNRDSLKRTCRFEELERRELLSVDPAITVGASYVELGTEVKGDNFYIAWVASETGSAVTTLDSVTINLDKNGNGALDSGECYFDTVSEVDKLGYEGVAFNIVEKSSNIGYTVSVEDGGMLLKVDFTNFYSGDVFVFNIDVDEKGDDNNNNALAEGMEVGGSNVLDIAGSRISMSFSSDRYEDLSWEGMYLEYYDDIDEYDNSSVKNVERVDGTARPAVLSVYDTESLPTDADDNESGLKSAGIYDVLHPTPKPIVISGYVYADYDRDCDYDIAEDDPLANVEVTLRNSNGDVVATDYTDADGHYEFGLDLELAPDTYDVYCQTDVPTEDGEDIYYDYCAHPGTFGEKVNPLHIVITGMEGGDSSPDNNFSKVLPGSISGYVFEDHDDGNNMNPAAGDVGIANVKVDLWKLEKGVWTYVESTVTNEQGAYRFEIDGSWVGSIRKNINEQYQVREGAVPEEYSDGKDYIGTIDGQTVGKYNVNDTFTEIQVDFGDDAVQYNFGEVKLGSIAGNVYEDRNDNGTMDDGEAGIGNVDVTLYRLNSDGTETELRTIQTNEDGSYKFDRLDIACEYVVRETQPDDYSDGKEHVGTLGAKTPVENDCFEKIYVGWDQHGVQYDFGELKLGSIAGNVYEDRNDNGTMDDGEAGIGNVSVTLYRLNNDGTETELQTIQTNADGSYLFANLAICCNYVVRETQPGNYSDGKEHIGSLGAKTPLTNDRFEEIQVNWDQHGVQYDFGELKLGSIAGNVYEDRNDNGTMDEGETGIGNVYVTLFRANGDGTYTELQTVQTNADGSYLFSDLPICYDYAVRETQPEDYSDGKEHIGSLGAKTPADNDYFDEIYVGWDQHGVQYDFGELKLGSIAGNVYEDRNDNGIIEESEAGIANIEVGLYVWQDNDYVYLYSVKTEADGSYIFDNLDINREYAVREGSVPKEYSDGKDTLGSLGGDDADNDYFSKINVGWDQHGVEYNFGEIKLGSIAGNVFHDVNDNGIFDRESENGIANVTVELYQLIDGEYVLRSTTTTAEDGSYRFDALDINQTYAVKEIQPQDYLDGQDSVGSLGGSKSDDYLYDISVAWDQHGTEYNFGELLPEVIQNGGISGYVYVDANKNGNMDDGEEGIVNVTVTLYVKVDGEYVSTGRTALTDESGYYRFYELAPDNEYQVVETQPATYIDGQESVGTLGGDKSINDRIFDVTVGSNQFGLYYNFGEYLPDPPKEDPPPTGGGTTLNIPQTVLPSQPVYGGSTPGFNYIIESPIAMEHTVTYFGGGGATPAYTWHLSVLNGGYPRSVEALNSTAGYRGYLSNGKMNYMNVSYSTEEMQGGEFLIRANDGSIAKRYIFGTPEAIPIIGDWDGDGVDNIGIFAVGNWCLDRNGDGIWNSDDLWAELGSDKDQPVAGDWDGDGKSDIGIFGPQWAGDPLAVSLEPGLPADLNNKSTFTNVSRPKNVPPDFDSGTLGHRTMVHRNNGQMRLDLIDHVFEYGHEGDRAVTGDWNGDGVQKIGVYRAGKWYLDVNGNGRWDEGDVLVENFGEADGIPVVGDFDGDGIDNIGLFSDGKWTIDMTGDYKPDTQYEFGQAGDKPFTGDFDGDGKAEAGVYRPDSASSSTGSQNK